LAAEASRCPCFRLELGARVEGLLLEDGVVRGVEYRQGGELRQLRATLTVGADGRFSMTRKLSGLDGGAAGRRPAMDVIWVRLPFSAVTPPSGATFRLGRGGLLVLMRHLAGWQAGLVIAKGSFPQWREAGIERLRDALAGLAPELAGSAASLHDWEQTSLLSVESSCLRRWHRPGLLLIGDAAHVVSPVGGVGINLAVQDALAAGRRLARPLLQGRVTSRDLAGVQRERVLPTRLVQACQALTERLVVRRAISPGASGRLPAWVRLLLRQPAAQRLAGELIAFAARPRRARAGGRTRPLPQPAGCHGRTRSLEGPLPAAHDGLG
ncbi:MAG TPA: FAD-dependent monooxygenase, partial [Deinococcales bacterium]|nr:FAD-dependent monooxygenase [Deinococcales bacterium]